MSRWSSALPRAAAVLLAASLAPVGAVGQETLHPALAAAMQRAAPGELLPAYVVVRGALDPRELEEQLAGLDPRQRRTAVADALRAHAASSLAPVRARLAQAAADGRARLVTDLWMGHALVFEAEPSVIASLADAPGVDRIRPRRATSSVPIADTTPAPPPALPLPPAPPRPAPLIAPPLPPSAPSAGAPSAGATVELNLTLLQAPELWARGYDGSGLLVASIDGETLWTHPDLINRTWTNPGEIPGNLTDDDANGFIDDIVGWDFADDDNDPTGPETHGTNVAGLLVGDGSAGKITGMAPGGSVVICTVDDEASFWLAQQYALDLGVDVVSSSFSYKWTQVPRPDYAMHRAMAEVERVAGIVHTNSIGNQGDLTTTHPVPFNVSTPGHCPSPWGHPDDPFGGRSSVLACAGIKKIDDSLYTGSGQGPSAWEDVTLYDAAYPHAQDPAFFDYPYGGFGGPGPGLLKPDVVTYTEPVTTTHNFGTYLSFGGTSAATPQLGGGVLLLRQVQPEALPRHIDAAIQLTAEDLGPAGKDIRYGAGKLQVFDAARRLLALVRAQDTTPTLGTSLDLDLFGETDGTLFLFAAAVLVTGPTDWNLGGPIFELGLFPLGPTGESALSIPLPVIPSLLGLPVHFQAGAKPQHAVSWGTGPLLSVPETVVFSN